MKLDIETISITNQILDKLNESIKASLEFEKLTGKQLNITSTVGEVLICHKLKLKLVVNDINAGFDALDKKLRVQIKTRRYENNDNAMTGSLLDKNNKVPFDYAILILLNKDYTFKEYHTIYAIDIQNHFDVLNERRKSENKKNKNKMSISQFRNLAKKTIKV